MSRRLRGIASGFIENKMIMAMTIVRVLESLLTTSPGPASKGPDS